LEVFCIIFIAHHQPTKVEQPGKESFDLPASAVTPQATTVLGAAAAQPIRGNHFGAVLVQKLFIQSVAVVGFIPDQLLRYVGYDPGVQRSRHQLYFSWRSAFCPQGERKTVAVCHTHDLGALAPLGLADQTPPFLAGTNVPSTKHSLKSKPPASWRCFATASNTSSMTPARTQLWNRRCTVWYDPYRGGRSCHGAPVRRIQRIPFRTVRRSLQGRPRRSARTRSGRKILSTTSHCSSVKSPFAITPPCWRHYITTGLDHL
jgi:hypothetical protein